MPTKIDSDCAVRPALSPTADFLRSKDAAQYLRDRYGFGSSSALEKFRPLGQGPQYYKPNDRTVVYSPADLDAWATNLLAASHITPRPAAPTDDTP